MAANYLSLSAAVPLRKSTVWGAYETVRVIPHVYGRVRMVPLRYDRPGVLWALADHAILGVDEVRRDNRATVAYDWRNAADVTGHSVALLELHTPLEQGEELTVELRGKAHPITGALLINPALIAWDLLANVAGQPLTLDAVQAFREECAAAEIEAHWMLEDGGLTLRGALAQLLDGIGARWSPAAAGFALLWPPVPS